MAVLERWLIVEMVGCSIEVTALQSDHYTETHVHVHIYALTHFRCFGLLISPGKDVKNSEMNLLDNMVS